MSEQTNQELELRVTTEINEVNRQLLQHTGQQMKPSILKRYIDDKLDEHQITIIHGRFKMLGPKHLITAREIVRKLGQAERARSPEVVRK